MEDMNDDDDAMDAKGTPNAKIGLNRICVQKIIPGAVGVVRSSPSGGVSPGWWLRRCRRSGVRALPIARTPGGALKVLLKFSFSIGTSPAKIRIGPYRPCAGHPSCAPDPRDMGGPCASGRAFRRTFVRPPRVHTRPCDFAQNRCFVFAGAVRHGYLSKINDRCTKRTACTC